MSVFIDVGNPCKVCGDKAKIRETGECWHCHFGGKIISDDVAKKAGGKL